MLSPVAMSIMRNTFEGARERAQAIGVFAAMFGVSMALAPVLGGLRRLPAARELVYERSYRVLAPVDLVVSVSANHCHPLGTRRPDKKGEEVAGRSIRPMQILDH
jgi:MFS family permease